MNSFPNRTLFPRAIGTLPGNWSRLVLAVLTILVMAAIPGFSVTAARASSLPAPQSPLPAAPSATPGCTDGTQASGALYRICFPTAWNGDVIVYAHGAVDVRQPLAISDPVVIPGTPPVTLSQILLSRGFAFATSSYSKNGLAVLEGVNDLQDVVHIFKTSFATPHHVYIVGFSEGGLISALSVEGLPAVYNGGIAGCGDVGSVRAGVNYTGDVRVVFDYFFPNLIPGNGNVVPPVVIQNWDSKFGPAIKQALLNNPDKLRQIMSVAGVPVQTSGDTAAQADVVVSILKFEAFGVGDYIHELGGRPYDNRDRVYTGSDNDALLNDGIQRYRADPAALVALRKYETSGALTRPLVTMHTTRDWLVLFGQEALYSAKTGSNPLHINMAIDRDGHCTFTATELAQALTSMVIAAGP